MKVNVDYDFDEVIRFCEGEGRTDIENLAKDLNKLITELDNCQDKFHCKGGDNANAVIKIYKGFAAAVGKSNSCFSGDALGGLVAYSAQIVNTCYSEATVDKNTVEQATYINF